MKKKKKKLHSITTTTNLKAWSAFTVYARLHLHQYAQLHLRHKRAEIHTTIMTKCYEELTYSNFYVSVLLEGLSLMIFVFVGGSAYAKYERPFQRSEVFEIACVYGIMLTVLSQCLKDVSKAHINPAITLANVFTRRVSLLRGCCYIMFQFFGGKIIFWKIDIFKGKSCAKESFVSPKYRELWEINFCKWPIMRYFAGMNFRYKGTKNYKVFIVLR